MATYSLEVKVNGKSYRKEVEARRRLCDFLREDLGLTGTHVSCEHGVCGVCTVIVDGRPRQSCLTLAVQVNGCDIRTVEGLARGSILSPLQEAFWDSHALQCGFCTPGFLMALTALFERNPDASDDEIREVIDGILCRCTGYVPIVEAAIRVRDAMRAQMLNERKAS